MTPMERKPAGGAEPVAIRPLRRGEVVGLWPLLYGMSHGGAPPPPGDPVPPDVATRVARVQGRPEHCLSVAVASGELVGYAWAQDYGPGLRRWWSVARLHDLYVTPGWRRRGVGRTLFEAVREWAAHREPVEVEGIGPVFPHVIVIDPENEQLRLAAALGEAAQVVLVRPGNGTCLNPFDVPGAAAEDDAEGQDVFDDHVASTLLPLLQVMLAEPGQSLSLDEVGVLDRAVRDAYARAHPATPLMADLLFVLERAEGGTAATHLGGWVTGAG